MWTISKENSIFLKTTLAKLNSETQLGEILQDWIRSEAENRPLPAFKWDRSVQKPAGIHGDDKVWFRDFSSLETYIQNCLQTFHWVSVILGSRNHSYRQNRFTKIIINTLWHGSKPQHCTERPSFNTYSEWQCKRGNNLNSRICITEPNISRIKGLADQQKTKSLFAHNLPFSQSSEINKCKQDKCMRIFKQQDNSIWFSPKATKRLQNIGI